VDNASTDGTPAVVGEFLARAAIDLRCVREPEVGLDAARNTGIREACGDVVAFLDDDARARSDWASAVLEGFRRHDAPILGGRVDLIWERPRPDWFGDVLLRYLIQCDYGPEVVRVTSPPWLYGTNVAFRRSLFQQIGLFRLDLDRKGDSLLGGGDTEFFARAHARGHRILYLPDMVVRHLVPATRLSRAFFRRRLYYSGYTRAALGTERWARIVSSCILFAAGSPICALAAVVLRVAGRPRASFAFERLTLLGAGYLGYWTLRALGMVPPARVETWDVMRPGNVVVSERRS
jgi:glucosyl-dolichyl phosphate glucuronosyltransferase